jgi:hypothetical protein
MKGSSGGPRCNSIPGKLNYCMLREPTYTAKASNRAYFRVFLGAINILHRGEPGAAFERNTQSGTNACDVAMP